MTFFRNFAVNKELGVLTWEGGVDIAPETLYAEATRTALPNWMEEKQRSQANKPLRPTAKRAG